MDCKRKLANLADSWHLWKVSRFLHIFLMKKLSHLNGTKHESIYLDFNMFNSISYLCDPVWSRSSNTDIMSMICNSAQAVTTASTWLKELRSLWFVRQRAIIQRGLTVQEKLLGGFNPVTLHVKSQPYIFVRTFIAEKCIRHDFLFFRGRKFRVALSRCQRKQQHKTQEHLYLTTARCLSACCSDITTVIIWTHYLYNLLWCMCFLLKHWISGGQALKPPLQTVKKIISLKNWNTVWRCRFYSPYNCIKLMIISKAVFYYKQLEINTEWI